MNEQQADALIDELHELNKTLKAISSSPERKNKNKLDVQKIRNSIMSELSKAFNCELTDPSKHHV